MSRRRYKKVCRYLLIALSWLQQNTDFKLNAYVVIESHALLAIVNIASIKLKISTTFGKKTRTQKS